MSMLVTADDGGYSASRDAAIAECVRVGVVRNVSLLVNGVSFGQQLFTGACLGLHFNLTEGKPVCGAAALPRLVGGGDGLFRGKQGLFDYVKRLSDNTAAMLELQREVVAELEQQYARFSATIGHPPRYLDGHNHIQVFPGIHGAMQDFCRVRQLPLRWPEPNPTESVASLSPYLRQVAVWAIAHRDHEVLSTRAFLGLTLMGPALNLEGILQQLDQCRDAQRALALQPQDRSFSIELMTHPGQPRAEPDEPAGCHGQVRWHALKGPD